MPDQNINMNIKHQLLVLFLSIHCSWIAAINGLSKTKDLFDLKLKMSNNQIRDIIDHFKTADPVGIPGAPIPDPMPNPDIKLPPAFYNLHLQNNTVVGLSKFKLEELNCSLNSLEIDIFFMYDKLELFGNYSTTTYVWFKPQKNGGVYNATFNNVTIKGTATLDTHRNGHLQVTHVDLDTSLSDLKLYLEKPITQLKFLQGVVNSFGIFLFQQMKPFFEKELKKHIKEEMNNNLLSLKKTFPNSISPLDFAMAEARRYVREEGLDPYALKDYNYNTGLLAVHVRDVRLHGLATFYRLGNMTIVVKNHAVVISSHFSTQRIEGKCNWEIDLAQMASTFGKTDFTIDYIQVEMKFNQSLDLRNKPVLESMDIHLGNLQLRSDGLGTLDYALELVVNVFPNLLRSHIVDGLEGVLKQRIQTVLQGLDVEDLVEQQIRKFDSVSEQDEILEYDEYGQLFNRDYDDLTDLYNKIGM